ncbi:hypothetical protein [Polynucleobacter necessarius]|uniref:hypothetical protein n=1 Tax=Polynucleobacter necessarius TaxID=576610 RepID=UPI001E46CC93|nr:hypothetical protein [Polynucleobacter necessarius]
MYVEQIMTMLGLSNLQFALAVIGLLILVSVAFINFKYSRARRKAKEQNFLRMSAPLVSPVLVKDLPMPIRVGALSLVSVMLP